MHVFIASNFRNRSVAGHELKAWLRILPSRTIRHVQVPIYAAVQHPRAATYIRVQLRTYTRTILRT